MIRWSPRWQRSPPPRWSPSVGRPARQLRAENVTQDDADRAGFTLVTPEGTAAVALRVVGAHQVGNALTAAAVGRAVGLSVEARSRPG